MVTVGDDTDIEEAKVNRVNEWVNAAVANMSEPVSDGLLTITSTQCYLNVHFFFVIVVYSY